MSESKDLLGAFEDSQKSSTSPVKLDNFRDSLNLEDFEKVDADQLSPSGFASSNPSADAGTFGSDALSGGAKEIGAFISDTIGSAMQGSPPPKDDYQDMKFDGGNAVGVAGSIDTSDVDDFLSGAGNKVEELATGVSDKVSDLVDNSNNLLGDFNSGVQDVQKGIDEAKQDVSDFISESPLVAEKVVPVESGNIQNLLDDSSSKAGEHDFLDRSPSPGRFSPAEIKESPVKELSSMISETIPSVFEQNPRDQTPSPREPTPPPRQPTPPREPTPPPREPTPPPKQPTPPPREPTPPPREPTPPPREPTPPPREPTPPPRQPTPPPREPTPPPREPTPPPREPTPPPREPTPPPREPTPPPREPTPPPKVPSPIQKIVAPVLDKVETTKSKSSARSYPPLNEETRRKLAVFKPLAELIYWRDVKKSGIALGVSLVVLLSLSFFSLISVLAYSALTVLVGAVSFRIYMNIKQAVQKTQDGHPFKEYLSMNPSLPTDNVHGAVDVMLGQLNSTLAYLHRIFLVEDLIDSCKFGCYLWVLTYIGAWMNGLTIIILAVIALFSLPKAYEQNKEQADQYMGLVQTQVNQVLEKVKAVIPIGGAKDKEQ